METQATLDNKTQLWTVLTETICEGRIPAYYEETETGRIPVTFSSEREAWKEIADFQILRLQAFIEDESRPEDETPEFEPEDYPVPCTRLPDGRIVTEYGIFP
jgi:hypothetical protein